MLQNLVQGRHTCHEVQTRILKSTPWTNHLGNYAERLKTIVYFHTGVEGEQTSGDKARHVVFTETNVMSIRAHEGLCCISSLFQSVGARRNSQ